MIGFIWWSVLFLALMCGCATKPASKSDDPALEPKPGIESQWGVKVQRISLSAEGYMLDFRYRVVDAEKAKPLFSREHKAYLVDESTGAMLVVPEPPKVGALRSTRPPQAGRNYFIMFANPGRYVQKGKTVTVVIGDFKAEHLVVE